MNTVSTIGEHSLLKQTALAVKAKLDNHRVGYGSEQTFTSLVSPSPFLITNEQHKLLETQGRVIRDWISTTNALYHQSLHDPSLAWLRDLMETGLDDELREVHRALHRSAPMRPPLFLRMDQPSFSKAAEAQTPGSGWGYHAALATCYEEYTVLGRTFVLEVANNLRALTGKARPRVVHLLHKDDRFGSEARYFASAIRNAGIDFVISVREIPKDIETYDVVFRHYLDELRQYTGWKQLLERYRAGAIEIDPAPNALTDHKIAMVLPFHPATFHAYTDAVRALFPPTYLVDPYATYIIRHSGRTHPLRLGDIADIPNKRRQFTLKYAGADPYKRAGGRGVLNLSMCGPGNVRSYLQKAIDDSYHGEPWLLQELVRERFSVTYLEADGVIKSQDMYARINPYYALPLSGGSNLLGCPVHFRNFWKVHGSCDAVETILAVA